MPLSKHRIGFVETPTGGAESSAATIPCRSFCARVRAPRAGLEWRRLFSELLGTFFLVLVVAGGAVVNAKGHRAISGATAVTAPGLMVMAIIMNPARSFGPDLALADFSHHWVYVVGPITGALIAVGFAWVLRGAGGDVGGVAAGQGALEEPVRPN